MKLLHGTIKHSSRPQEKRRFSLHHAVYNSLLMLPFYRQRLSLTWASMIGLSLVTATLQRWQEICGSNLPSCRALTPTQEVWQWQLVRIAITIRMVSAARGCGSISVMTVASTSATTVEQPQEMAFAALTVTLTTPRRITSATETPTDH